MTRFFMVLHDQTDFYGIKKCHCRSKHLLLLWQNVVEIFCREQSDGRSSPQAREKLMCMEANDTGVIVVTTRYAHVDLSQ